MSSNLKILQEFQKITPEIIDIQSLKSETDQSLLKSVNEYFSKMKGRALNYCCESSYLKILNNRELTIVQKYQQFYDLIQVQLDINLILFCGSFEKGECYLEDVNNKLLSREKQADCLRELLKKEKWTQDITKIEIEKKEDFTSIPPEILNLKQLTELTIHGCFLKYIPESLKLPETLEELDLSQNKLKEIPEQLFMGLTNLRSLSLAENERVQLPSLISLTSLEDLILAHCKLVNIPEGMPSSLQRLDLLSDDFNNLDGISQLTQLTFLNISGNNDLPANKITEVLAKFENLQVLGIGSIESVNNDLLMKLTQLPLKELDIVNTHVTTIPSGLSTLTKIVSLDFNSLKGLPKECVRSETPLEVKRKTRLEEKITPIPFDLKPKPEPHILKRILFVICRCIFYPVIWIWRAVICLFRLVSRGKRW